MLGLTDACRRLHRAVWAPARRREVPGRRPAGPRRHAAAAQPRHGHHDHPDQAGAGGRRARRTGRSCARRVGSSRSTPWPICRTTSPSWSPPSPPAAASCTGPATPPRPTGSSSTWSAANGVDEVVKVKSMATQEIGLNEALGSGGIAALGDRPGRAHRAAGPRHASPHPGAGDPPQPRRDPRHLPARDGRCRTPALTDEPAGARRGRPPAPAARSSCAPRSRSAARTSRSPRPARSSSSSPRATAGCA